MRGFVTQMRNRGRNHTARTIRSSPRFRRDVVPTHEVGLVLADMATETTALSVEQAISARDHG
jgi:hypothetical protein